MVGEGADLETVRKAERLLYPAEHKPRQGGPKNIGPEWRHPIINRFRDPGLPGLKPDASISPAGPAGTSERLEE